MAGRSILYLGGSAFAADFVENLKNSPVCGYFGRSPSMTLRDIPEWVELVLFEVGPAIAQSGQTLQSLINSLSAYPLVAVTSRDREHRGIAAVSAGAQGYVCTDNLDIEDIQNIFDHAIQRHQLVARLSDSDNTVLSILKSINDGVIVADQHGHVLDINPAARSILGLGPRNLPNGDWGKKFCSIAADGKTPIQHDELPLVQACRGQKFSNQVAVYRQAGQSDTVLSINGQGLYDGSQSLTGGVITFRDVTEVMRRTVELEKRAQYDELTLLPNRRLFTRQLEKAMGRSQRRNSPIAVLFIDLDRFKSVNDTLGHDIGDELLRQVGRRLIDNTRIGDFSGRWGGDEFVVCLEDFGEPNNAAAAAQKLVLVLSEKYDVKGSEVYATPSIGIAIYPGSGETAERLIKAADLAMYQAKNRGGGRFQYYSNVLNSKLEQREELEIGLRHALVREEFVLHYQPRIDVGSGRLIGLEALLRWQHPRFGLLPPARFLSILESTGLIHSAGEWVLDTATRQLAAWQNQFELPDLSMAINLSPQQLVYGRLVEAVTKSITDTMLDPGCIELEIGDGDIVRQRSNELDTLQGLRKLGVRLSLDHFGIRDVSFSSLDTGVIDSFVLDQSLIQDVEENNSHQRIIRAAIAMARGLDIEVAAEGVETLPQFEFLRSCQCDLAQGFLISRPIHADKVASILRSEIAGTRLLARGMP
ncbi:MAG: EAL domain-containing protein [Gammaproteobacteria bacterium]|nr:EAL domain-containing protein [Gammaproteobacteria bacterium]